MYKRVILTVTCQSNNVSIELNKTAAVFKIVFSGNLHNQTRTFILRFLFVFFRVKLLPHRLYNVKLDNALHVIYFHVIYYLPLAV